MVQFRIGTIALATLEDADFASVLQTASLDGGAERYPALFTLSNPDGETDPLAMMDDLARLASTEAGQRVSVLIGTLRDDLMAAVAASDEG